MLRPCRRPATTPTSPTGSTACRRRTRSPTRESFIADARAAASPPTSGRDSPSRTPPPASCSGSVSLDRFAERRGGGDRLLGQAGGAPPGRSPGGGASRRRLGLRRARRRAPRAAHVPGQRGLAGAGRPPRLHARVPAARLPRAGAGQEPGGAGRAVRGRQPAAPRRPGAVRAPARRLDAIRMRTRREAPDLAEPAPLSGLSPERFSLDPANLLDEKSLRAFT